jgi:hypothetical protein
MDTSRILVKTSKGVEEMKQRSFGLSQTIRALLIMADGATSLANLLLKTSQIPKAEENFNWLIKEGFVASVLPGQRADSASGSVPAAVSGSTIVGKQALIAMTRELLGGDAAKVIQRLEDVQDARPDLLAAVDRCHKFIKLTIDEDKAHSFLKASHALLAEMG